MTSTSAPPSPPLTTIGVAAESITNINNVNNTTTTTNAAATAVVTNNDQINSNPVDNLASANDRSELDLNCRNFDAKAYIQHTLQGASHSALDGTQLLCEVSTAKQESSENMKQLIKDNLAVFINSKDAISAVYNSDAELFTGVALEQIRNTFKQTKENGREMLQPLLKLYDNVQKQRATQQLLEKMASVLSIPGILYKCASVRVAVERTHNKHEMRNSTDAEFTNTRNEQNRRSKRLASSRRPTQGLLEEVYYYDSNNNKNNNNLGSNNNNNDSWDDSDHSRYVIHEDEEIFYWYGTPLVRFRDAEVQHNEEELYNNYEGAVMALRRALRYIEENYNIETGKLIGENEEYDAHEFQENDSDEDEDANSQTGQASINSNKVGQKILNKHTLHNRTGHVHFNDKDIDDDDDDDDSEANSSEDDSSSNNDKDGKKGKEEHKNVVNASAATSKSNSHKHDVNQTHSSLSSQRTQNSAHRKSHNSNAKGKNYKSNNDDDNSKSSFVSHEQQQNQQEQRQAERERVARRMQSIMKRHSRDLFLYYYASALLKSTLYLIERSAYALQHVSATDTVRIEDLLSAMMDFTLASVKLRHVCFTLHERLRKAQALPDVSLYSRQDNVVLPSLWALKMQTQQHTSGNESNEEGSDKPRRNSDTASGNAKMTSEELPDRNSEKGLLSDLYTNPPSSTEDANLSHTTQMNSTTSSTQHTWLQESDHNKKMKTEQLQGKKANANVNSDDDNKENEEDNGDDDDYFGNSMDSLYDDDYYYKYKYDDVDGDNDKEDNYNNTRKHKELDANWTNTRPMQPAEYYIALIRKQHDFMMRWITSEIVNEAEDWFVKIRRSHGSVLLHFDYLEEEEELLEEHQDDEKDINKNDLQKNENNNNEDDDDDDDNSSTASSTSSSSSDDNEKNNNNTTNTTNKHIHVPNTSSELKRDKQLDMNDQQPRASELLWDGMLGNTENSFVMKPPIINTASVHKQNLNTPHSKLLLLPAPPLQQQQQSQQQQLEMQESWQNESDLLKAINSHTDNNFNSSDSSSNNKINKYRSKRQQRIAAMHEREERSRELLKAYHAENEEAVLSQGNMLSTFMLRLWANILQSCETTLTAYWSGIASAIHAGLYDYYPSPKSVMDHILHGPALTPILGNTSQNLYELKSTHAATSEEPVLSSSSVLEKQRQLQQLGQLEYDEELSVNNIKNDNRSNRLQTQATAAGVLPTNSVHTVPLLRFIPILYDQGNTGLLMNAAAYKANSNGQTENLTSALPIRAIQSLRSRSIDTVEQIITQTTSLLRTLLLPFIHTSVCYGFVESMSAFSIDDVRSDYSSETVELHAALLVEVIIGQWESMMNMVQTCALHIKVAIGESATSSTLQSEMQASEIRRLLHKLEEMQHECVQLYLYGLELLAKAYVHVLPSLQIPISFAGLDHRIRARLSRDYVSTNLPNKLLNLFSVVLDRTLPLLRRENEIFDAADLFAAKAEEMSDVQTGMSKEEPHHKNQKENGAHATRHGNIRRWRRGSVGSNHSDYSASLQRIHAPTRHTQNAAHDRNNNNKIKKLQELERVIVDLVTQSMAVYNASLVQYSIQHHTVHLEQIIGNLLMSFVDIIHGKGQRVSDALALHVSSEMKETVLVESIADALTLPTTVIPILEEHLLSPCLFANLVELTEFESEAQPANEVSDGNNTKHSMSTLERTYSEKQEQKQLEHRKQLTKPSMKSIIAEQITKFHSRFVVPVEEHTQLVIDALLNMYLTLPQQQITLAVRSNGFMNSLFDWQRFTLPSSIAASSSSSSSFESSTLFGRHAEEQPPSREQEERLLLLEEEEEQTEQSQGLVTSEMGEGVRLYIADCLTIIARAQEVLNGIHQPALGAAVTQKLMAHFANSFIAGLTFCINGFEFSHECSNEFKLNGSLLLEVEGLTILSLIEHLLQSHLTQQTTDRGKTNNSTTTTTSSSSSSNVAHAHKANTEKVDVGANTHANEMEEVLPELLLARTRLQEVVQSLITSSDELTWNLCNTAGNNTSMNMPFTQSMHNTELSHTNLVKHNKHNDVNTINKSLCTSQRILTIREREHVRTRMVHLAIQHTQYMIEAISSYLEESSLLSSIHVGALAMNEESTQRIAERLAKRLGNHNNKEHEYEEENKEEATHTNDAKVIPHMARRATKKLKTILRKRAERNDHVNLSANVNTAVDGDKKTKNTDHNANTTIPTSLSPASDNASAGNNNNDDHINKNSSTIEKVQRNATLFRNAVAAQTPTLQTTDNNLQVENEYHQEEHQPEQQEQLEKNKMEVGSNDNKLAGLADDVHNAGSTAIRNTNTIDINNNNNNNNKVAENATNVATATSAMKDSASPSAEKTQQATRRVRRVVFDDEHLTSNVKDNNISTNTSQRNTVGRTNRFRRKNVV